MKILGLKEKNINILTEKEIIKRAEEKLKQLKNMPCGEYILNNSRDNLKKCKSEPMPYKLFRLNELFDFNLNFIGCEITEEQYYDRLGQLPPVYFKYDIYEGFFVNECITENRFEHCFEYKNKYYCVIMDLQKNEVKQ